MSVRSVWEMVFQERKMMAHAFLYSQNRHMSVGGGAKCAESETIRNNAPLIPAHKSILIFISQAF